MVLFFAASCAGSPPPVEEIPEPPAPVAPAPVQDPNQGPPNQTTLDALDAAIARADRARQGVIDFDGPGYFPGDWDAAESRYRSITGDAGRSTLGETLGETQGETQGEAQELLNRYNAAADAYEDLFRKTLPRYAEDREKAIQEARNAAISAGIQTISPEHLRLADQNAGDALDQYEKEEYYSAAASADLALARYQVLKGGVEAYKIRQEIVNRDFIPYDPDNFDKADQDGLAGIAAYEAENMDGLQDAAEKIFSRYDMVLKTGWISYAAERGAAAGVERQAALDAKANVAVRNDFNAASTLYSRAGTSFNTAKYDEAAGLYAQSEVLFAQAGRNASDKRRAAEAAIRSAEEKMIESDENARNAELIIEGGGQ
jgi:hypothetical protein